MGPHGNYKRSDTPGGRAALRWVACACLAAIAGLAEAQGVDRTSPAARRGPALAGITAEPPVRIRVGRRLTEATVWAEGGLTLSAPGAERTLRFGQSVRVRHSQQGFVVTGDNGRSFRWEAPSLMATPLRPDALHFEKTRLPGSLALVRYAGRMDAVNHTSLEQYLPGVLERELYPKWRPAAYRAQAVAARSYALWERGRSAGRHFDLESTTASQAYAGRSTRAVAIRAVADTRGVVLAYRDRVLPAFYSSSTGGTSQDATSAFPDRVDDLPPLRGGPRGSWGQASPMWRWSAITRDEADVSARVRAWGRANRSPAAELGELASIRVAARSAAGRPTVFEVRDRRRRSVRLACEQLRAACNYAGGGIGPLPRGKVLPSSYFTVRIGRGAVRFENGRGYGHGVGLGQWGAQGMAEAGQDHPQILAHFYPGARLVRAYE